jgi:hypothetical protein
VTYALVQQDTITQVGFPSNGVYNDGTRDWDLRTMSDPELAAIGWLPVTTTSRPPDTATTTFDYSIELVGGVPTEVWTERPMTQAEIDAATNAANAATLQAEIAQNIDVLLATVDNLNAITAKTNAEINANPAAVIKDVAREAKTIARQTVRIARVITGETDTTDSGS